MIRPDRNQALADCLSKYGQRQITETQEAPLAVVKILAPPTTLQAWHNTDGEPVRSSNCRRNVSSTRCRKRPLTRHGNRHAKWLDQLAIAMRTILAALIRMQIQTRRGAVSISPFSDDLSPANQLYKLTRLSTYRFKFLSFENTLRTAAFNLVVLQTAFCA